MAVKRFNSTQDLGIDPYGGDYGYTDPAVAMPDGGYPPVGETSDGATPNPPTGGVTGNAGSTTNPGVTRTTYDPLPGWDVTKLNQGTGGTNKYQFGRWLQNSNFYNGGSGANSRGQMSALVDAYNQATGGKASAVGDDSIDFGDGLGVQDVINGNTNQWQWVTPGGGAFSGGGGNTSAQMSGLFSQLGNAASLLGGRATAPTGATTGPMSTQPLGVQRNASLSTAMEAARMPYEMARRTQMNNARADLANRGLLSEPGHMQGPEATAINQIESNLAPAYTGAINDRLQQMDALALGELEQNRLWQQFMLDNNLNADRVRADILNGNTDRYLQLLQLWLNAANVAADGFI